VAPDPVSDIGFQRKPPSPPSGAHLLHDRTPACRGPVTSGYGGRRRSLPRMRPATVAVLAVLLLLLGAAGAVLTWQLIAGT